VRFDRRPGGSAEVRAHHLLDRFVDETVHWRCSSSSQTQ
jgi:hypothetical protein